MKSATILFLVSSMQIGGQEQYIAQQILNLDKEKYSPILCCLKNEGPMADSVKRAGIQIFSGFQRFKYDFWSLWRLTRFLIAYKPDILYIFDFRNVLFIGRLAALLARVPLCVIASHKMNFNGTGRSYGQLDRLLMPLTHHVIAMAHTHRSSLIRNDGLKPDIITVIHNGIQISRLEEDMKYAVSNKDIGVPEGARIVGTIARLSPEKSLDILLEAARIVIDRIPKTHLVFIGDGPERKKLSSIAAGLGIEENVHFLGFKQRVAPILKLFDVFVLSSTATELFSAATLEAMAMKKPVVVTDVGSMREMVESGVTGFIVPPFDTKTLAGKILELLDNPQNAKEMGQAGKERVEKSFTADREARELEALFYELLTNHRAEVKK